MGFTHVLGVPVLFIALLTSLVFTAIAATQSRFSPAHWCVLYVSFDKDGNWSNATSPTCLAAIGIGAYSTILALILFILLLIYRSHSRPVGIINTSIVLALLTALVVLAGAVMAFIGVDRTCKNAQALVPYPINCADVWQWNYAGTWYYPNFATLKGGIYAGFAAVVAWILFIVTEFFAKRKA
ncbi:hypothetical protein HDV00_006651 [Rhizophlyctis rosea]|nr:hypothetical protein HDV00_006651 [Rhizophlyctis rosea]